MLVWTLVGLLVLAAILAGLGIVFMGVPGLALMHVAAPLAAVFTDRRLRSEEGWPEALTVSFAWPWAIPACYLLSAALVPAGGARWAMTTVGTFIAAIAIATAVQVAKGVANGRL